MPFTVRPKDFSEHGVSMVRFGERRPLLEVELNEVQQNLNKKTAEIVKQSAYSGFLKMNDLDGFTRKQKLENLNKFYLTETPEKIDVVNLDGYILALRNSEGHGNIAINLPPPPETGTEENLVFLEYWFADVAVNSPIYRYANIDNEIETRFTFDQRIGVETTRRTQLRYRIRVEKNVDFSLHEKGISDAGVRAWAEANEKTLSKYTFSPAPHDPMLFRAGTGDETSISFFNSVDGYVYALPLFKVHRRNTGGFTKKNPNGGIPFRSMSDRPDGLFADIIDKNDIVDLRNSISLTGFNYQKLLAQEFDKFLRAENEKARLTKTYHGIPKTPQTTDTIFYASFDRTTVAEVGGNTNLYATQNAIFAPSPTGYGVVTTYASETPVVLNGFNKNEGEISFLTDFDLAKNYDNTAFITLLDEDNEPVIQIFSNGNYLTVEMKGSAELRHAMFETGFHYVTLCWKKGEAGTLGEAKLFIDGLLKNTQGYTVVGKTATKLLIGCYKGTSIYQYKEAIHLSDLHISKKCTAAFGSMPIDFQQGYANITPKFSGQRRTYGDGQISQITYGRARISGTNHSAGITKQQATNGAWAVNDKITISALGGELISGVIDSSTRRVRITESVKDEPSAIIKVASATGFVVGDVIAVWNMDKNTVTPTYNVTAVNTAENTITLNTPIYVDAGSYIINRYFTTQVPTVWATVLGNASLSRIAVNGTWTGLGSKQATFTISSITNGYTYSDIVVEYSLNAPARQRGLTDSPINVYEAEINGERLFPRRTFSIIDDLKGKIPNNTTSNPNLMKFLSSTSLGALTAFTESSQSAYTSAGTLNGEMTSTEASTANQIPQRLFTFDLIKIIEQKFGKEIPDVSKSEWLKRNIEAIRFNWHGYGLSPTGAKASLAVYNLTQTAWNTYMNHTYNYIYPLSVILQSFDYENMLSNDGLVHFLVYAEKALNAEQIASLFTDYVSIELVMRGRDNYEFLVPVKEEVRKIHKENYTPPTNSDNSTDPFIHRFEPFVQREISRRDVPVTNLLFIQKSTKRIELLFDADSDTQVVTYSSHKPLRNPLDTVEEVTILAEDKSVLLTDVSPENAQAYANHHWKDPLYRVRNYNRTLSQNIGFKEVPFTADSLNVNVGALITVNGNGPIDYFTRQYVQLDEALQAIAIAKYLVLHKGEIKLLVLSLSPDGKLIDLDRSEVALLIRITGNPIAKDVEGIKRTDQLPTTWRTSTGNLRGYIDEYGTFVATYQ